MNLFDSRKWASIIDLIVIAVVAAFLTFKIPDIEIADNPFFSTVRALISNVVVFLLILFKDLLFRNASIGKRIFKICIVDKNSKNNPTIVQLIIRNLTWFIFPIEFYFVFIKHKERLGDRLAKTEVVLCVKHD